ncbi:MAG: hypothetical protein AAF632_27400 [Bacteroidota bacterium]
MFQIPKYTQYSKTFFLAVMLLDAFCLYFAFDLSSRKALSHGAEIGSQASFYVVWALLWTIISLFSNQYSTTTLKKVFRIIKSTVKVILIHALFIFVYLLTTPQYFEINYLIDVYLFSMLITIGSKFLMLFSYRLLSNQRRNKVNFIIVGNTPTTQELLRSLDLNQKFGHHFYGFLDNKNADLDISAAEITKYCEDNKVNYIYFDSSVDIKLVEKLTKYANNHYIRFSIVHDPITIPFKEVETSVFNNIPVVYGRNFENPPKVSFPGVRKLFNSFKIQ